MKKYSNADVKDGLTRILKIAKPKSSVDVSAVAFGRMSEKKPNLRKALAAWRNATRRARLDPDAIWRNTRAISAGRALPFED